MEHFKKIKAIEDGTTPPMPMSASVRSQNNSFSKNNDCAMDLMSTLHKNDVVADQEDSNNPMNNPHDRSRNQGKLQNSTIPQRAASQGRADY